MVHLHALKSWRKGQFNLAHDIRKNGNIKKKLKTRSSATTEGRATRYVSKFTLCFTSYGSYKGFKQQKWPSRSFKGTDNGAIQ